MNENEIGFYLDRGLGCAVEFPLAVRVGVSQGVIKLGVVEPMTKINEKGENRMSGIAKKVIMITLGLLIAFGLLVAVIPEIQAAVTALETLVPAPPTILLTLANLWWIPMVLVLVALVVGGGMYVKKQFAGGRGRSRRR